MSKFKFTKTMIVVGVCLVQPVLNPASFAWARRKTPPKAFSFISEGGKASQGECDGERTIPRRLKHLKEYAKANSYMGSELQTSELKGKTDDEMWKHFFRAKPSCNTALAKTPSAIQSTNTSTKTEIPPEDDSEPDNGTDQTDSADPE